MGKPWRIEKRSQKREVHVLAKGQLARLQNWLVLHGNNARSRSSRPLERDRCSVCGGHLCVGDVVVSRSRSRNYHQLCWEKTFQGGD